MDTPAPPRTGPSRRPTGAVPEHSEFFGVYVEPSSGNVSRGIEVARRERLEMPAPTCHTGRYGPELDLVAFSLRSDVATARVAQLDLPPSVIRDRASQLVEYFAKHRVVLVMGRLKVVTEILPGISIAATTVRDLRETGGGVIDSILRGDEEMSYDSAVIERETARGTDPALRVDRMLCDREAILRADVLGHGPTFIGRRAARVGLGLIGWEEAVRSWRP